MAQPTYLTDHQARFLEELKDWLRIPSVSADPKFHGDVLKAADYLKARLEAAGVQDVELCPTAGNPIVYGEYRAGDDKPTVLVYGHYDVQPADPYELWTSPPFEPVIKDEKIYARGACDDKGQVYMHVAAFEMMMRDGQGGVPCNIKFMFEGEEEIGSVNLELFVRANRDKLRADVLLLSDTGIIANDVPSIEVGLRGLSYHEVEVTGPGRDLHSGLYGGAVQNPINALCEMIASLHDANGHITIPGFYDNVAVLSDDERTELNKAPYNDDEFKQSIGLPDTYGEKGYTTIERTSIRPTLDVNGIWGGYTGEGAKTVIASKAFAKISMRLVPHQTSDEISQLFQKHFESIAPQGVVVKVKPHHGGEPVVTPTDSVAYKAAADAMETTFGKRPIPTRGGGSIPIVAMFKNELQLDAVMLGFGLDSDAIHSPNEHFGVFNFLKGIETIPHFYRNYAAAESR
ncbi:dipeptidase [Hymenobacter sp. ASUV-10]|uniref:Dipeptidase n=1 Tax=Hymenobacter aranciens TaxID=3063996 RepID=A0ABT9BGA4_9BACT|nr:dipeptidase [Hymenobacter sp. ASUV-10]MDO7876820.1 dipeptidase [Hymenobacter sp. ASUV-10]